MRNVLTDRCLPLILICIAVAMGQAAPPQPLVATTLAVPDRTNANVSLASEGRFVVAGWSASDASGSTDVYIAVSRDGGVAFSAPVRVNSVPGDARVNGEQPPRVVLVKRANAAPSVVVVWTSKSEVGTTILSARSDDGGQTFGKSTLVPGGEAAGSRGWESAAVDERGAVRVLWLDHREMALPSMESGAMNHAGHDMSGDAKKDGVAMAQLSKLYIATVGDPASARMLVAGVCYCCKTAIVTAADGAIYAAWRHVYPGIFRDMAFAMSRNGGQWFAPPLRVSEDKWQLDGCPDDGPAMAVDARNQIHLIWPTLVADPAGHPSIGLFYSHSSDGRAFSARERINTEGLPHHPQVVVGPDRLFFAWDELKAGKRQAVLADRPLGASTSAPLTRRVLSDGEPGLYPVLTAVGSGAVAAWSSAGTDRSVIRIARVP